MYIVFGNKIIDSKEIEDIIRENTDFNILKDMSKGTKREDMAAFNLSRLFKFINKWNL